MDRFGLKIAMRMIFMKFDNQNKLDMLIMNVLIGIDGLDPKLKICKIWSQKWNVLQFFFEILHLQQFEHVDYEYSTWNWWPWPKIIDSGKFGPNTDICSNFHKIRHDYRLRIIVGSEHGTIMRTTIVTVIVPWSKWL